jgi:hypothetical protein
MHAWLLEMLNWMTGAFARDDKVADDAFEWRVCPAILP